MGKPAVFWDRDDTLMLDSGYVSVPDQVELLPGAARAIRMLADSGFENVIVTNQSGIARGLFDEVTLESIHDRLREHLAAEGAAVDAIYYCPYLDSDEAVVEAYRKPSDLRKPGPGMILKASMERNIELAASWMIGDSLRDTEAGRAAGCRTILLQPAGSVSSVTVRAGRSTSVDFIARDLDEAVAIVLRYSNMQTVEPPIPNPAEEQPDTVQLLEEILQFIRVADRRARTEDFSLARMCGVIVQIVALGALIWAIFGMLRSDVLYEERTFRLLMAGVLQLIALTCFTISSKK
jgi:D-glycero-D-manno-heptose 1,7-bisphosphate phosphatase